MARPNDKSRIVIAVTERTPVQRLWQEVLQRLRDSPAEIHALFVADDRWHRAASLPFTREISRISGMVTDFTLRRASQVHEDAIDRTRFQIQDLALKEDLALVFEVLRETDQQRIRQLVGGPQNTLIAPSFLTRRPLFAELQKLDCRIILIEAIEEADGNQRIARPPEVPADDT